MELTRRDALAALAGAGIVVGGGAAAVAREGRDGGDADTRHDRETLVEALVGTARAVYPSEVENVREFVETYAGVKLRERPDYRAGLDATLASLDLQADIAFDADYVALDPDQQETVLRQAGADTAEPDPEGTTAERVRYYLVNEVLYALFTSPTGGTLAGTENPIGHPGGTASYQRGPQG